MPGESVHRLAGRVGGLRSWSKAQNRTARTQPARDAFRQRFYDEVPAEVTDPDERKLLAETAIRAHYAEMALKSARARRRKAS
jgi:hypothetical protein